MSQSVELQDFRPLRNDLDSDDENDHNGNVDHNGNGQDIPASAAVHASRQKKQSMQREKLILPRSSSSSPPAPDSRIGIDDDRKESHSSHRSHQHDTNSNGSIVHANNIHKTYLLGVEGVPALRGVTLSIQRGEFIMILGSSGGGKTSLLNILGTIDKPTKGELHLCGHRITSNTTDEEFAELRLRKIGFVFQTFNLIPSMTAEENVALPMILEGRLSTSEISARAGELLTRVGLGERKDHLPSQLSGGEQQRVTIARAIANRPAVLLLDEPTGDLDTVNGTIILSLLLHLNRQERMTCIMVTHDTMLKNYANRVVHMVDGKVARLENITQETRQEMDDALAQKVRAIRGEWSGAIQQAPQATTEYREAHDYESFLAADSETDEE